MPIVIVTLSFSSYGETMMIRLFTILGILCLATNANAQKSWSSPAASCIPDSASSGLYNTGVAAVQFYGSEVGSIVLTCQMERFDSGTGAWYLKMTYKDSTGSGTSAYVLARVYRMAIGTSTPVLLGEVHSNSSAVTAINTLASPAFGHTFDYESNFYWVRVILKRGASTENVLIYGVYLDGVPPA